MNYTIGITLGAVALGVVLLGTGDAASTAPRSLEEVGQYGEDVYDLAKAEDWQKATAEHGALRMAAKQLCTDLQTASSKSLARLDATIVALDRAITAKERLTAMQFANRITRLATRLTAPFKPPIPVEVTLLDYYGRELEVRSAMQPTVKLKATAGAKRRTWTTLRPLVESSGGTVEAAKFGDLVARVEAAKTSEEYARLAAPVLDEVDNLEKLFRQ